MAKKQLGITLDDKTLTLLDKLAQSLGLTKSQYISMLINQNQKKGLSR